MAWDSIKNTNDQLTAAEWNAHVTDQKNRVLDSGLSNTFVPYFNGMGLVNSPFYLGSSDMSFSGSYGLKNPSHIDFNLVPTIPDSVGRLKWDSTEGTLSFGLNSNVNLQVGQEMHVPKTCKNTTASPMANGTLVYINGAILTQPTIALASNTSEANSMYTIGMCTEAIGVDATGYVTTYGVVRGVNTNAYATGTPLWLGTNGSFTDIRPSAPNHAVFIGYVFKQGTSDGEIFVNIMHGYELNELHDVLITSPALVDTLLYNTASSSWVNSPVFSIQKEPTGFKNYQYGTTLSFNNSTRVFTVSSSDGLNVYRDGLNLGYVTSSCTISTDVGQHYIYYNASNVITDSVTPWTLATEIPISTIYWTGSSSIVCDERHGLQMDAKTHGYLHETVGARYVSGLSGTFTASSATITNGVIYDEDIRHSLAQSTQFRVMYRNGTTWNWQIPTTKYFVENADVIRYDNAGTLTDVTNNYYVAQWFYATNDKDYPIWVITGQRQDNTITDARNNNTPESLSFGTLPSNEMKLLYRVIVQRNGTSESYVETADYRTSGSISGGSYTATNHSALSGLTNDDHTQYALANGTRTFQLDNLSNVSIASSDKQNNYVLTYKTATSTYILAASTGSSGSTGTAAFAFERTIPGALFVGTDISSWITLPLAGSITKVQGVVKGQPTGASIIVDVNKKIRTAGIYGSDTTIFSTQASRLTIAASSSWAESGTPDTTSFSAGDVLTIDIDQVGSTLTGEDLTVTIYGTFS